MALAMMMAIMMMTRVKAVMAAETGEKERWLRMCARYSGTRWNLEQFTLTIKNLTQFNITRRLGSRKEGGRSARKVRGNGLEGIGASVCADQRN
eukprot:6122510-Pyramimonas_sp.AAC.1